MPDILILHLTRLGDLVQSNRTVLELKQAMPGCQIDFFALEEFAPALRDLPLRSLFLINFDDLQLLHRNLETTDAASIERAGDAIFGAARFPRYDRILNFDYSRGAAWLCSRIPADARQGGQLTREGVLFFPDDWSSYLHAAAVCQQANPFNLIDLQRGAAATGAIPAPDAHSFAAMAECLPFALPQGRLVAINPGASEAQRRWPVSHFARLIVRLQTAGFTPVLVGAPNDAGICASIAREAGTAVADFSGQTSLPEMARLLHQAELLVSNDTGAVHLAAAVGTRIVAIYEQVPWMSLTAPWSTGNLLLRSTSAGQPVAVEAVAQAALERLGAPAPEPLHTTLQATATEAWETVMLPEGCDPLGGVACLPLAGQTVGAAWLHTQVLRHVLAAEFCGTGAVSTAWLGDQTARLPMSATLRQEAASLASATVAQVQRCETLAAQAATARSAALAGDTHALRASMEQISATMTDQPGSDQPGAAAPLPGVQLALAFLDQKLASTGHLPLAEILAAYERESRRCARLLSQSLDLLVPVLEQALNTSMGAGR